MLGTRDSVTIKTRVPSLKEPGVKGKNWTNKWDYNFTEKGAMIKKKKQEHKILCFHTRAP
jgi:hypothetical protein